MTNASGNKKLVFVGMSGGVDPALKEVVFTNKKAASLVTGQVAPRVFCAMSGGVDSSVAAGLLVKRGYDVIGVHMRCYNVDGCGERDAEDARRAAEVLNIPFYVFDFEEEYKKRVVHYMVRGYKNGITPNPDVMCNKEIKFGLFLTKALEMGADYVATGHYARKREVKSQKSKVKSFVLAQSRDLNKDQSYFLWTLTQKQLKHCIFPIGDYLKSDVRELSRKFGLPNAEKKDSQGICFLGRVRLGEFLSKYIEPKVGEVRLALDNNASEVVGEHRGAQFYTIGQRHIGIMNYESRRGGYEAKPVYVVSKDVKMNTLLVAEKDSQEAYKREINLKDVNFINSEARELKIDMPVLVRVRYRQPLVRAKIVKQESGVKLVFNKPMRFIAPGQSAVFYSESGELLGGGVIS